MYLDSKSTGPRRLKLPQSRDHDESRPDQIRLTTAELSRLFVLNRHAACPPPVRPSGRVPHIKTTSSAPCSSTRSHPWAFPLVEPSVDESIIALAPLESQLGAKRRPHIALHLS